MTADRRFEQQLPAALDDLAMSAYPTYIDEVLAITARTRRRPAWQFLSRWLPFQPPGWLAVTRTRQLRPVVVLAVVVLLIAALVAVYVGSRTTRLPDPFGPAANGRIIFSADHAAYVVDKDGTSRLLFDRPGDDVGLTWSLDGTRIAFIQVLDGKEFLWAANADGSSPIQLVGDPLNAPGALAWSPDSRQIAIGSRIEGTFRVMIVEADGSGSRGLDLPFPARDPVWRPPDGRELAVRGEVDGHAQLYVVAADGSSFRKIGPPGAGLFEDDQWDQQGAAWSPDGTRLAYNSIDPAPTPEGYRFQVHIIESDGTNTVKAGPHVDVMESWPTWSPDGSLVAIERWQWKGLAWLAILPADGTGPGRDIEFTTPFQPAMGWTVTWSPDGTRILAFYDTSTAAVSIDVASGAYEELDWALTERPTWQRVAP